jgi:hypothetical protein
MGLRRALREQAVAITVAATAAVAAFAVPAAVLAYPAPPGSGVVRLACPSAQSGGGCPVAFQFLSPSGQPEGNVLAAFTVSGGGSVTPPSKTTDAQGQVQALYTASTTQCGTATINAATSDASVQTTVNVTCAKAAAGAGLPPGSSLPPGNGAPWWSLALAVVAIAGVVTSGTLFTISRRRSPRQAG